jgi:hypothetical protein
MARGISIHDGTSYRLVTAINLWTGWIFEQPVAAFIFVAGYWRQAFPTIPDETSFFLNPDLIGARAKAGVAGSLVAGSPYILSSLSVIGSRGNSNVVRTSDPAFIIGMPSFLVYNPATFNGQSYYDDAIGTTVAVSMNIIEDGRWVVNGTDAGTIASGSWGVPTTTDIGLNYWVRFILNSLTATPQTTYSPTTGWQRNVFGVSVSVAAQASGFQNVAANYTCQIATDAAGANIVAQGTFVIRAEHFFNLLTNATFHGITYSDSQVNNGVTSFTRLVMKSDGSWDIVIPAGTAASGAWGTPLAANPNPAPGTRYQVRFTLIGLSASGGAIATASTGWLPLSSNQSIEAVAGAFADRTVLATYTVEVWNGIAAPQSSTIALQATYDHPFSGTVTAPNGGVTRVTAWPSPATAIFNMLSDGNITITGGATSSLVDWFVPNTTNVGSSYWLHATYNPNFARPGVGTFDIWLPLSSTQSFGFSGSIGSAYAEVTLHIATAPSGSSIISTGMVAITAESSS